MREKEEILDFELKKLKPNGFIQLFYKLNREKVLKIIEDIQIEAYNSALEDAAKYAISESENHPRFGWCTTVNKNSIFKLKK